MAFESVDTLVWREAGGSDAVNQIIEKAGRMGKVELPDAEVRDGNWSAKKLGKLREDVGLVVIKWLDTIMSGEYLLFDVLLESSERTHREYNYSLVYSILVLLPQSMTPASKNVQTSSPVSNTVCRLSCLN